MKGFSARQLLQLMVLLLCMLPSAGHVFCQEPGMTIPDSEIEQVIRDAEVQPDLTDMVQEYEYLARHPVDLNRAEEEDLRRISFLTDRQINAILAYIQVTGSMLSLYELGSIDALDSLIIARIIPLITIKPHEAGKPFKLYRILKDGHSSLMIRCSQTIQKAKGYDKKDTGESAFAGSPQGYYFRYQFTNAGRLQWGISGKKDPGEQFFRGNQPYGMDVYSGFIRLKDFGPLKDLIAGSFQASFGQCLTLGTGQMMNTSMASFEAFRYNPGFRPSLSTSGSRTLNGVAATFRIGKIDLSPFYSFRKRDATIGSRDPVTGKILSVTTFQESGYHRTGTELEKRNALSEQVFGGNIRFMNCYFSMGATAFSSHWNARVDPVEKPYDRYHFRGKQNLNAGVDFRFRFGDHSCFGEFSISRNGGKAWIAGIQANPEDGIVLSLVARNYQPQFQDLFSRAFGKSSVSSNEQGIFFNIRIRATDKLDLSGYADACRFPWLKYAVDFPSTASEWGLLADFRSSVFFTASCQARYRYSWVNMHNVGDKMHRPSGRHHLSLRIRGDLQPAPSVQIHNRIDFIHNRDYSSGRRNGMMFLQDIRWTPQARPFRISFRYALFDTDSWEERICTYEQDVLYGFSAPSLDGRGIRCYLTGSWIIIRNVVLWAKIGNTWYADRTILGSGEDQINGDQRTEVRLQVQFKW